MHVRAVTARAVTVREISGDRKDTSSVEAGTKEKPAVGVAAETTGSRVLLEGEASIKLKPATAPAGLGV